MSPASRLLIDCLSIVLIDLLLAGDNALIIAMAVRSLPPRQRRIGILAGAGAAVALRIGATVAAAQLLNIELLKLVGGALVIWIGVKVLADAAASATEAEAPRRLLRAIWYIVFADITMSIDNVLAVAGAARGNPWLIVFGLALSIPFVVFSSNLLSVLMDRYPFVMYIGAAILGKVGAEMMLTDPFVVRTYHPPEGFVYAAEAIAIAAILVIGRALASRARRRSSAGSAGV